MGNCLDADNQAVGGGSLEEQGSFESSEVLNDITPSQSILLRFKCQGLYRSDRTSKSDPFIVIESETGGKYRESGRTEIIMNNENPSFSYSLRYLYKFEEIQRVKISVYDADESGSSNQLDLTKQDFIGSIETTISDIVVKGSNGATYQLINPKISKPLGAVTIFGEEVKQSNSKVEFTVSLSNFFRGGKIFFQISTMNQANAKLNCFRSETNSISNGSCFFRKVHIDSIGLCNSEEDRPIIFTILLYKSNGSHNSLAECQTKLSDIRNNPKLPLINLINSTGSQVSYLQVNDVMISRKASFISYIQSGCEINFMVGIDFTGSNGDPRDYQSLHHINLNGPNQYEQSISSIGGILEYYDTDKLFPTYLFGGKINGQVEHCYPLNGNYSNPELPGIQGILEWYHTAINHIQLYGPTCFAPLINAAGSIAAHYDQPNVMKYLILLILTDGVINDMDQTISAIINSCMLPLSIIIIGVGDADFTDMSRLDGDNQRLRLGGRVAERDIVQFVSLKEILSQHKDVASLVLQEVPSQLTEYMSMKAKYPR